MGRRRMPYPFSDPTATQEDWDEAEDANEEADSRAEDEADDAHTDGGSQNV